MKSDAQQQDGGAIASKDLFVPLKRQFFEAFERGEKSVEYRIYGPRWNELTCQIGRMVTLSLGYGKRRRLRGVITDFRRDDDPGSIPGWSVCYGTTNKPAACISIAVNGTNNDSATNG